MRTRAVPLFEWQRHVTALGFHAEYPFDGRPDTARRLLAFAIGLSVDCKGTTGRHVVVHWSQERIGIPVRTVRRYVEVLTNAGLLTMTLRPARTVPGREGRRAEYALTLPVVEDNECHDAAGQWHTFTTEELAHVEPDPCSGVASDGDLDVAVLSTTSANSEREVSSLRRLDPDSRSGQFR